GGGQFADAVTGRDPALTPREVQAPTQCLGCRDRRRDQQRLGHGGIPDVVSPGHGAGRDEVTSGEIGPGGQAVGETREFQPRGEEPGSLGTLSRRGEDQHPSTLHCRTLPQGCGTARSWSATPCRFPTVYVRL